METTTSKSSGELGQVVAATIDSSKETGAVLTEYEEYLELHRKFTGKRLQKLIRKVEYVPFPVSSCPVGHLLQTT